jgi:hypothetical protein
MRRGRRDAGVRRPRVQGLAVGGQGRAVPARGGRRRRTVRAVAAGREPRERRLSGRHCARVVGLGCRADLAAAQRTGRAAAAAAAPAAFRDREHLLRDHALRPADRDADLAVRPAPRRLPGGAQRDGGEHGDLPAHLLHSRGAAAPAVRHRHRGPGGPVRRVGLLRDGLDGGRRPAVRHAVGPRRLVDPGRLGRHHPGPQPLALADPAAPGDHGFRRRRDGQSLLGRRHRRGRDRRRGHRGGVAAGPRPAPGARRASGGRAGAAGRLVAGPTVTGRAVRRAQGRWRAGRGRRQLPRPSR